jgi:exportin-2 (importin alpha re-exporter)
MADQLHALAQCMEKTITIDKAARSAAEEYLAVASKQPNFVLALLKLIDTPSFSVAARQGAAIYVKNFFKKWQTEDVTINDQEKEQVKTIIVDLMLKVPETQKLLKETIKVIADVEFPLKWPALLPGLASKLQSQDFSLVIGSLKTLNMVMKKYRSEFESNRVLTELKFILENFQDIHIEFFKFVGKQIEAQSTNEQALKMLFLAEKLMIEIFLSLSSVDLPEHFENNLGDWMKQFNALLNYNTKHSALLDGKDEDSPGLLTKIKAVIFETVKLYTEKYDEETEEYVKVFVKDAWTVLGSIKNEPAYDVVATSAIRFLTAVSSTTQHTQLKERQMLEQICTQIILPNLQLRENEEEMFEDEGLEYIRMDTEGSDVDSRRRAACDLVRGLRRYSEDIVTQLYGAQLQQMLTEYTNNKALWKLKDTSIALLLALSVTSSTVEKGATSVNKFIPIADLYQHYILPELQSQTHSSLVIVADCIKFCLTFRQMFNAEKTLELLPLLIRWLAAPNFVVHSYAAMCIDRLLTVKDGAIYRLTEAHLLPGLGQLYQALFAVLALGNKEDKENHYVMRTIMRLTWRTSNALSSPEQSAIKALGWTLMEQLLNKLGEIFKNPSNPLFIHFLHESIVLLAVSLSKSDPVAFTRVEEKLFPMFRFVLENDAQDLQPYEFQVLSVLLERYTPPHTLRPEYAQLLPVLVSPTLWERRGNVPGLTRVISQLLRFNSQLFTMEDNKFLLASLGVFQKLVASKQNDGYGFNLLESIILYMNPANFAPYMSEVMRILFTRLQSSKTAKFVEFLLYFFNVYICKHGGAALIQQIDAVQPGIFLNLLQSVWLPHITTVSEEDHRRICAIGSTKLMAEWTPLYAEPYVKHFAALVEVTAKLISQKPEAFEATDLDQLYTDNEEAQSGFSSFSQLAFSPKPQISLLSDVNAQQYFVTQMMELANKLPPALQQVIKTIVRV